MVSDLYERVSFHEYVSKLVISEMGNMHIGLSTHHTSYIIENYFTCSKKSRMSERDRYFLASSLLSQSLSVPLSHHSVKMKKHRGSEYPPICAALTDEDDCPNLKKVDTHINLILPLM